MVDVNWEGKGRGRGKGGREGGREKATVEIVKATVEIVVETVQTMHQFSQLQQLHLGNLDLCKFTSHA